jgi:uncharacterized protein (TIGR02246 family)
MTDLIADRLAVQDVMSRYATGVDTRDLDLYATCFADDVVATGFGPDTINGREAWVGYVRNALERFGATQHLMGNQVVELDGDTAKMKTYVQATHVLAAEPKKTLTLWATYDQELVRDGDRWRIKKHRLIPAHTQVREGE